MPEKSKSDETQVEGVGLLKTLSEVLTRLEAVEADNASMRAELADAREKMGVGMDNAHVNHFADKWFHHDRPENVAALPPEAKFDPFTGERLVSQRQAEAKQLYS